MGINNPDECCSPITREDYTFIGLILESLHALYKDEKIETNKVAQAERQAELDIRALIDGKSAPIVKETVDTIALALKKGDQVNVRADFSDEERRNNGNAVEVETSDGKKGYVGLYTIVPSEIEKSI